MGAECSVSAGTGGVGVNKSLQTTSKLVAQLSYPFTRHTRFTSFAPVVVEPPPGSGRPRAYEGAWRCLGFFLLSAPYLRGLV